MANPSLQIGNGKFAIKENDLLGYSSSGTRFFPIPITMTRATLGSRVNPSGLIENVELLGSELVSCGNFECANPDGVWNRGTGWEIANGKANSLNSSSSFYQASSFISGKSYKVTFDITNLSSGQVSYRTNATQNYFSENGTHTINWLYDGSFNFIYFLADNFTGSIDNVSVKEVTRDGLARVDYTDGTGSLLVEPQRTNLVTYSEDFSQWDRGSNTSLTYESDIIAPDGSLGVYRLTLPATFSTFIRSNTFANTNPLTLSVYVKSASSNNDFNLYSGTLPASPIKTATSDWQKFDFVTEGTDMYIVNDGDTFITDIYIWGAQAEAGSYATSYIKTQGSSVTRNQDEYTKTGISDKINSEEGVLFVEIAALSDNVESGRISVSNGTVNEYFSLDYRSTSNTLRLVYNVGGTNLIVSNIVTGFSNSDLNKIAYRYKSGQHALYVNGISKFTSTETSTYAVNTLNQVDFRLPNNTSDFNGKVKQLQIYKTALSDSELATLTTI